MFDKYLFAGPSLTMWYREDFEQMGPCWFPLYLTLIYVILNCSDLWRYLPSWNRPSIETCFRQAVGNLKVFPESFISLKILSKYVYWFLETEKEKEGERKRERESEKERERNISVWEKHSLVASHVCPDWGSNLQPFDVQDDAPTNWATPARAWVFCFLITSLKINIPKGIFLLGGEESLIKNIVWKPVDKKKKSPLFLYGLQANNGFDIFKG